MRWPQLLWKGKQLLPHLVTCTSTKCGIVTLLLWTKTSHFSDIMCCHASAVFRNTMLGHFNFVTGSRFDWNSKTREWCKLRRLDCLTDFVFLLIDEFCIVCPTIYGFLITMCTLVSSNFWYLFQAVNSNAILFCHEYI